jgi:hypothetical protein
MAGKARRKANERLSFKDLADALEDGRLPSGIFSGDLLRAMLGTQRALLQQYQTVLKEQPADDALMEHHREAMRALLACWLEMGDSIRSNLDGLLSAQSKFLAQYLQVLDGLVKTPDKRKSSH